MRRRIVRAQEDSRKAALDVELYAVRERVENLFFAILLTEQQIAQNRVTHNLLMSNLAKIRAMVSNGTAMQSDADMVEARALTLSQAITGAESALKGYRNLLEIFIGESLDSRHLSRPAAAEPAANASKRPELTLLEKRQELNRLTGRLSDIAVRPRVGLFAQAYYGYPGMDYFRSMMERNMSFNLLAGVRVAWSVDALYTQKNSYRRTLAEGEDIAADRDLFLFNSGMLTASQRAAIDGLRNMMRDDSRIIELRAGVRRAAEIQLENGIIDADALLSKISDENLARLAAQLHELQLIQEIYKLKYTLNR